MDHQQSDDLDYYIKEAEEFEATKAGVKGLVDSGIKKIPKFFIQESGTLSKTTSKNAMQLPQVPIIDLKGIEDGFQRAQILEEIREASENWGFFQIINHGVSQNVMHAIIEATRRFHEQPKEAKMELYSPDARQQVRFFSINGLFRETHCADWRDVFACNFLDDALDTEAAIPEICRNDTLDYMENMMKVRDLLSEILSEALGLDKDYLDSINCLKSEYLTCLYYPACPEPHFTIGSHKHSDSTFMTVLVQDNMGGLQVLYQNDWIDVTPLPGALVVNIGELIQLITNDKFKSVEHRVLASYQGPRISVGCFFYPSSQCMMKPYGPIKELLSDSNPPIYKEVTYLEYIHQYRKMARERNQTLPHFKLYNDC
ncbi:hypothetical protein Leryth_024416 [Lithospermum erythrorhizon]|nr:hypothetical protein Leryth_024416 [Lithospermum erythrorhizon]